MTALGALQLQYQQRKLLRFDYQPKETLELKWVRSNLQNTVWWDIVSYPKQKCYQAMCVVENESSQQDGG